MAEPKDKMLISSISKKLFDDKTGGDSGEEIDALIKQRLGRKPADEAERFYYEQLIRRQYNPRKPE